MRGKRIDVEWSVIINFLISVAYALVMSEWMEPAVSFLVSFVVIGFFQMIMRASNNHEREQKNMEAGDEE